MSTMNDDDRELDKRQVAGSDIGPEPDWLADSSTEEFVQAPPPAETVVLPATRVDAEPVPGTPAVNREHPWLWGMIPLVLLAATALVAWFATTQHLNNTTIWNELREDRVALLPARWTMLIWWVVTPLMALYLIWSMTPAGRVATRIKRMGPLLSAALVGVVLWMVSQLWNWNSVGLIAIGASAALLAIVYVTTVLGRKAEGLMHRLSVSALGAAMGFSTMLLVLTWQQDWQQPFGMRGTAVVLVLVLVFVSAFFGLMLKESIFAVVMFVWFIGVVQQQWGADKAISLTALVAAIFTAIIVGLSVLLSIEQQRDTPATAPSTNRSRTRFFRKSSEASTLPE